ncbi:amidohydrolase family protein [Accumulibacter sp.]|uniref:amidohydrolase family protein n=1 Tax=Accumulibacter sp. TaxID=2053492 RepID=UPI001599A0DC|nr:MAG: amidohydrolase family protein [Candidatus Accumulibacter similis]
MKLFDSLTHVTRDGSWCGERRYDASLAKLLQDMEEGNVYRACLVAIADYVDNEIIIESARTHPERFVPIAGLNPRSLPTLRRVEAVVAELAAQGFAGIKLHPRMNGYDPLDAKCIAVFDAAAEHGLVIMLDTLFRRRGLATTNAPDTIDYIANACPDTRILLLHAAGPSMLDLFEIVRANPNLMLDFSFTLMRYAGSRLDDDMRYLFSTTDQLITIGSDFPEYPPATIRERFAMLSQGIEPHRIENIMYRNLERLFAGYQVPAR